MPFLTTPIKDLLVFEPQVFNDERGYFMESFNAQTFQNAGVKENFVQDNQSRSQYGTIRGLHYQVGQHAQAKLVRCLEGAVLDVVVDIRPQSDTYGQVYAIELSEENKLQLYVPRGFAHGFATLTPYATFFYKCDNFYNKESEGGILWNDTKLNIDWQIKAENAIISEKDKVQAAFGLHRSF
jgi:dTDP-4-dehydrorhamnose 3,5-epimerase